jgi:signal transduction histidine kinase
LEIADNGQGLDGTTKGSGTGLKSMKKRAEDLGGTLVINSGSRQGTTVRLAVPYPFKIPNTWDRKIR